MAQGSARDGIQVPLYHYFIYNPNTARGTPGPTGPAGPTGAQGNQGPPGQDGQDGADGQPGEQGPAGPQGTAGADGAQGPMGPPGLDGAGDESGGDGFPVPVGGGDHHQLVNLNAYDDHLLYFKLGGRVGGQTGYGGSGTGENLDFHSNPLEDGIITVGGVFGAISVNEGTKEIAINGPNGVLIVSTGADILLNSIGYVSVVNSAFAVNGRPYLWPALGPVGVFKNDGFDNLSWEPVDFSEITGTIAASQIDFNVTGTPPSSWIESPRDDGFEVVGTVPSVTSHHQLLGWDDFDDHAQYTKKAGRTGTTNDTTLSTSTDGTLLGSSSSGKALILDGGPHADGSTHITLPTGLTLASGLTSLVQVAQNMTFSGGLMNVISISEHGQWTITANYTFLTGLRGVTFAPNITNDASNKTHLGSHLIFYNATDVSAVATTTISDVEIRVLADFQLFNNVDTGTLTVSRYTTVHSEPTIKTGATVTNRRGLHFMNRLSTGTQTNSIAVDVEDQTVGTIGLSLRSLGAAVQMRHAGPGVFGANAAPTNASVALEVQSTTLAFLMSRMTRAQRNTLAGVAVADGMLLYDSSVNKATFRQNANWVEEPWDICISKAADQTVTNNSTLQDDTDLQFTVASGETWHFELCLAMTGSNTTGDGKFQLLATAATFANSWRSGVFFGAAGALDTTLFTPAAFTSTTEMVVAGGLTVLNGDTNQFPVYFRGAFRASGAATVKVQFANVAAAAGRTTIMKAGSTLRAKRMLTV